MITVFGVALAISGVSAVIVAVINVSIEVIAQSVSSNWQLVHHLAPAKAVVMAALFADHLLHYQ